MRNVGINLQGYLAEVKAAADRYHVFGDQKAMMKASDFEAMFRMCAIMIEEIIESYSQALHARRTAIGLEDSVSYHTGLLKRLDERLVKLEHWKKEINNESLKKMVVDRKRRKNIEKYKISNAEVSVRAANCLRNEFSDSGSAFDVSKKTSNDLLRIPNFGRATLKEVREWLNSLGLKLSDPS